MKMMLSTLVAGGLVDLVSRKMSKLRISEVTFVCVLDTNSLHYGIMETPFFQFI